MFPTCGAQEHIFWKTLQTDKYMFIFFEEKNTPSRHQSWTYWVYFFCNLYTTVVDLNRHFFEIRSISVKIRHVENVRESTGGPFSCEYQGDNM